MGGPCTVDGESRDELDNWFKCRFKMDGKEWPSSEHYYQASKYPGDEEHQEKIRAAPNGTHCWALGQEDRPSMRKDWDEVKVEVMYDSNRAKFSQNPKLKKLLVSTEGPITAMGDPFWKTWNEVLLERLREELRDFDDQDSRAQALRFNMMKEYQRAAKAGDREAMEAATHWASKRQLPPKKQAAPKAKTPAEPTPAVSAEPTAVDPPLEESCSEAKLVEPDLDMDSSGSESIKAVFRRFDLNKNGVIEKFELTQLLQDLDEATWSPARCGVLLKKMDVDADGVLSYCEFVDWVFDAGPANRFLKQDFRNAVEKMQPGCLGESVGPAAPRVSVDDARAMLGMIVSPAS
mmetsp:Transcript_119708/g.207834  ORF Transcript_119708/g.207834 Transcript_119708/m.207834 type:complete len:348 (-) Transcript_119708:39-1082(-)